MLSHDTNNWLRHITFNGENKTVEISKHFDNFWNQIYKYEMPILFLDSFMFSDNLEI